MINPDGTEEWWQGGRQHREDGPAAIKKSGSQYWYKNGQKHSSEGPAVSHKGKEEYWLNGEHYKTKAAWKIAKAQQRIFN